MGPRRGNTTLAGHCLRGLARSYPILYRRAAAFPVDWMLATQRLRSDISQRRLSVLLVPNVGFRHAHCQFLSWCAKRPLDATRRYFADDFTTVRECRSRGQSHLLGDIADTTSGALVTGRVHGIWYPPTTAGAPRPTDPAVWAAAQRAWRKHGVPLTCQSVFPAGLTTAAPRRRVTDPQAGRSLASMDWVARHWAAHAPASIDEHRGCRVAPARRGGVQSARSNCAWIRPQRGAGEPRANVGGFSNGCESANQRACVVVVGAFNQTAWQRRHATRLCGQPHPHADHPWWSGRRGWRARAVRHIKVPCMACETGLARAPLCENHATALPNRSPPADWVAE